MQSKAQQYTFLLLISLIWGSQFIFTAWVLPYYTPIEIALLRAWIGAITLTIILFYLKENSSCDAKTWIKIIFISIFEAIIPLTLIAYGLKTVAAGTAAIIMATTPLFALLFDALFNKRSIKGTQLMGVILGFAGILVLFWHKLLTTDFMAERSGELSILLAAISFAFSLILVSKLPAALSPVTATRNILLTAGIILLATVIYFNEIPHVYYNIPLDFYVLFLGIFCSGFVYVLFIRLVRDAGPVFASLTNYLVPVIAVIIGVLYAAQVFTLQLLIAALLIVSALAIIENRTAQTNKDK